MLLSKSGQSRLCSNFGCLPSVVNSLGLSLPRQHTDSLESVRIQQTMIAAARVASRAAGLQRALPSSIAARGYHENIVEHYENPRNVGSLDKDDSQVGTVRKLFGQWRLTACFGASIVLG